MSIKPTHPASNGEAQTHFIILEANTMVQTPAYPESYSPFSSRRNCVCDIVHILHKHIKIGYPLSFLKMVIS